MKHHPLISTERKRFHAQLLNGGLTVDSNGVPAIADKGNKLSIRIAKQLVDELGESVEAVRLAGQTSGKQFEDACSSFLERTFLKLDHLRPGRWTVHGLNQKDKRGISRYQQYAHLYELSEICRKNRELASAVGYDYIICPDIVITREPETDDVINAREHLVDEAVARQTGLRHLNNEMPILHASISCKWTIRSDRAQNSRAEALNLIRNRKGRVPHVTVVTAEPLPSRLASLALGTGDLDCVYHLALPELQHAVQTIEADDAAETLRLMVEGNRLRDIADLPLDLAL